ncbi:MAG: cytochrome c [Pseudomonadota bacterium]
MNRPSIRLKSLIAVFLLAYAGAAWSADSADTDDAQPVKPARSGEELAKTCAACHGAEGISISPDFPNLAGQYRSYLLHALKDYRSGERANAIMMPLVKDLSDQELKNLADYYANMSGLDTLPTD